MSRPSPDLPVVVVGAGLAGLWTALCLAPRRVVVLTGGSKHRYSSSSWAQGGIAAALGPDDSPADHAADTLRAGDGLCNTGIVNALTEAAPGEVQRLADAGVAFERTRDGGWMLSREAAHGRARVARVDGDRAGAAIVEALMARAAEAEHIELRHGFQGAGLLTNSNLECGGAMVVDADGRLGSIPAQAVVLATGGVGGLYSVTTNPSANQGQALAWAARLGARIRNPEFVQFHPTAMALDRIPAPLATEALRGEGATLIDCAGQRFMPDQHPDAELAPRDVVARAVHREVQSGGAWLDARTIGDDFPSRFPTVYQACVAAGLDPRMAPIPIAPAAHFHMGGIATSLDGATEVPGLFAVGEVACTGAHGANRLASNALLEAAVMARKAAERLLDRTGPTRTGALKPQVARSLPDAALKELREAMQRDAGVERHAEDLQQLLGTLADLEARHGPADAVIAARSIAASALARNESRGAHARLDFPERRSDPRVSEWRLKNPDADGDRIAMIGLGHSEQVE